jgi:hypothetical protein
VGRGERPIKLEIARTPRNAFRCSLEYSVIEVELLIRLEGFTAYQPLINSECYDMFLRSEGMGAKVRAERERTQTIS